MTVARFLILVGLLGIGLLAWMYRAAVSDPVLRRADIAWATERDGRATFTALLISDLHVAGPDMPPERLARVVERINGLQTDLVLIAGDFVSEKKFASDRYPIATAVAPLGALRPKLGTFAVLGNHDHWRNAAQTRQALRKAGVTVLDNDAVRAGPFVIGGLDDAFTGHEDLPSTLAAMRRLGGKPILLSHSPDPFPEVPHDVRLMLAGHTHCGQIRLPLVGALTYMSDYGERYACGLIREEGKVLIVSAGLGTSLLPLRLGAVPDMWLITLTP